MSDVYKKLIHCFESIQNKIPLTPKIALVLGSGLGDYAEEIKVVDTLDYKQIEQFPQSTVSGHKGRFVFGYVGEVPVVIMQGRVHYYEGYPMTDVVLPIRLMKLMGAEVLFLTNASGGVNKTYHAGDFMIINDHISTFIPSPLMGENINQLGTRFPDMSEVYNKKIRQDIKLAAEKLNISVQEGVYVQLTGPQYETPTEIQMVHTLGADAVGMSTVCEAIVANHMGMKVCGISCITNMASGITKTPLSHTEVKETADRVAPLFKQLVTQAILQISTDI